MSKSITMQNAQMVESQRRYANGVTGRDLTDHQYFDEAKYWDEENELMEDLENE